MKTFLKRIYYVAYAIIFMALTPLWIILFFLLIMITGEFKDYRKQRRERGWII